MYKGYEGTLVVRVVEKWRCLTLIVQKKTGQNITRFCSYPKEEHAKKQKKHPKHVLFMSGCKQLSRTCADDYYQISSLESNLFVEKKHLWGH